MKTHDRRTSASDRAGAARCRAKAHSCPRFSIVLLISSILIAMVSWPGPGVAYAEPDVSELFHTPRSLMLSALDVIENEFVDPVDPVRLLNAALGGAAVTTHVALPALPATLPEPQSRLRALGAVAWAAARASRSLNDVDEAAAAAMLAALHDSHTVFLPSQAAQEVKLTLAGMASYSGTGIRTRVLTGADGAKWPYIADVLPHGPADVAGVRAFDRIVRINGTPTANLPPADIDVMLRGRGTVVLEIIRLGHPLTRTVTRSTITVPGAIVSVLPGRVVSARFFVIRRDAVALFEEALSRLDRQGRLQGVLIDFRDTPGGEKTAIPQMLQLFLPAGTPIFHAEAGIDRDHANPIRTYIDPLFPHVPLAVLVNRHTASAAELIAATLRDTHRATVVGERTAGAVGGAVFQLLPRGTAMLVTVEHLTGARGERLEGVGIQPDLQVAFAAADLDRGLDAQVAAALGCLRAAASP